MYDGYEQSTEKWNFQYILDWKSKSSKMICQIVEM